MRLPSTILLAIFAASAHSATFGDQSAYTGNHTIRDVLTLVPATPSQSGLCDSVTALLKFNFDSCKVRAALYTVSGNDTVLVLNGVSVERRFTANALFDWHGFAFPSPKPAVQASTTYLIALFGDTSGVGGTGLPRAAIATGGGTIVTRNTDYESGFPQPANPTTGAQSARLSVYVTYTPDLAVPPRRRLLRSRPQAAP